MWTLLPFNCGHVCFELLSLALLIFSAFSRLSDHFILPSTLFLSSSVSLPNVLLICFVISPLSLYIIQTCGFCFLSFNTTWIEHLVELGVFVVILVACLLMFLFVCLCVEACGLTVVESFVANRETSLVKVYFLGLSSRHGYLPLPLSLDSFYLSW